MWWIVVGYSQLVITIAIISGIVQCYCLIGGWISPQWRKYSLCSIWYSQTLLPYLQYWTGSNKYNFQLYTGESELRSMGKRGCMCHQRWQVCPRGNTFGWSLFVSWLPRGEGVCSDRISFFSSIFEVKCDSLIGAFKSGSVLWYEDVIQASMVV
jgi:hypothetical protein